MELRELVYRGRDVKKVIQQKFEEYQLRGQHTYLFSEGVSLTCDLRGQHTYLFSEGVSLTCDYSKLSPSIVDKAYTLFTVIVAQMIRNKSTRLHYTVGKEHGIQTDLILLNLVPGILVEGADLGNKGYLDLKLNVDDSVTGEELCAKRYYDYALVLIG